MFVHDGLSPEDFHADPGSIIEHTDVVATILGTLGRSDDLPTAGIDLVSEPRARDLGFNQVDIRRNGRSMYAADSIWWPDGGYLVHRNRAVNRLVKTLYGLAKSASRHTIRHRPVSLLRSYLRDPADDLVSLE